MCTLWEGNNLLVVGIDGVGLTSNIDLTCILENSYWIHCHVSRFTSNSLKERIKSLWKDLQKM